MSRDEPTTFERASDLRDVDKLEQRVDDLEQRVEELEDLCRMAAERLREQREQANAETNRGP